jgi:hypothetical protein
MCGSIEKHPTQQATPSFTAIRPGHVSGWTSLPRQCDRREERAELTAILPDTPLYKTMNKDKQNGWNQARRALVMLKEAEKERETG